MVKILNQLSYRQNNICLQTKKAGHDKGKIPKKTKTKTKTNER